MSEVSQVIFLRGKGFRFGKKKSTVDTELGATSSVCSYLEDHFLATAESLLVDGKDLSDISPESKTAKL